MTALHDLIGIQSFRGALRGLIESAPVHGAELRAALGAHPESNPPDDLALGDTTWPLVIRAYRILYEISIREGREELLAELMEAFPDAASENVAALHLLLEDDPLASSRIEGLRKRDAFLPVLASGEYVIDLRVTEVRGDEMLLPVVTCRLEFDEPVGGGDAVVFQMPPESLADTIERLTRIQHQLATLRTRISPESVPDWAVLG